MPAPSTLVILVDDDADEFPIYLPGVYRANKDDDVAAAEHVAGLYVERGEFRPAGALRFARIEYHNEVEV